ncbi:MAG: Na+/H+ antiporter NhaA [Pseudomonadota bacterium]|nr:Na+/H+ antiporter NhaA [Pseudomonadota bacterium]
MSEHGDHHRLSMMERFLHSSVAGSSVLVVCTVIALVWANSPWAPVYETLTHAKIGVSWNDATYSHSLGHWIKDGLMAIFFFVVGLEIKRELVVGELSSFGRAILPVSAALGGAIVPALIYAWFNIGGAGVAGWGIPMATDIAFALGVLSLFGKRVPLGVKVFLAALAIADDMLAVLVIALFYTANLDFVAIVFAGFFLSLIFFASRAGVRMVLVYVVLAVAVWVSLEASGIHATVAGVLIALLVPVKGMIEPIEFFERARFSLRVLEQLQPTRESLNADERQRRAVGEIFVAAEDMIPPGIALEKTLHPFVAFIILPLFALSAAGVAFDAETLGDFPGSVGMGIMLGLIVGKQAGIMLACWLAFKTGLAEWPEGANWGQIWGVSALAGIGFTMSIFIDELAFVDEAMIDEAKIAIILASVASAIFGAFLLNRALPRTDGSDA